MLAALAWAAGKLGKPAPTFRALQIRINVPIRPADGKIIVGGLAPPESPLV